MIQRGEPGSGSGTSYTTNSRTQWKKRGRVSWGATSPTPMATAHTVCAGRQAILNTADESKTSAAVQVHTADKAGHIPASWNFIRSIFTASSRRLMMTDRPGIPVITKLFQAGFFASHCSKIHSGCFSGHRRSRNGLGKHKKTVFKRGFSWF